MNTSEIIIIACSIFTSLTVIVCGTIFCVMAIKDMRK
jgi:type IV secretory pathway component VirB8